MVAEEIKPENKLSLLIVHDKIVKELQTCNEQSLIQIDDFLPPVFIALACFSIVAARSDSDAGVE